jgi:ATP-dependent DNA ligase
VVAKRLDSRYEPGKRSGAWCKYRINLGQEFVVGGYTPGGNGFDALIAGFYRGKDLFFAARVRAGFVPATRRQVFAKIKDLKTAKCPFVNLPEQSEGRWGQPGELVGKFRSRLRIAIGQVEAADHHAVDGCLQVATMRVRCIPGKPAPGLNRTYTLG